MLLSAVSVLVVAQSSSEIPEGLMNNPVYSISLAIPSLPKVNERRKKRTLCLDSQKKNYCTSKSDSYSVLFSTKMTLVS